MVVFLLTCALIMLIEGFCFWILKQISLSFIIPMAMAIFVAMQIGMGLRSNFNRGSKVTLLISV